MDYEILVVDDDADIRKALMECFESLPKVRVSGAGNGNEALETMSLLSFHLLITDVQMPFLDGAGLLRAIAARPGPRPTIFVMSGYSPYRPEELIALGAHSYFDKTDIRSLVKAAKSFIQRAA